MSNQEIADKIFNSYFEITKSQNKEIAKQNALSIIDAQITLMFQDLGTIIIDVDRDLYLEDWEEIKYLRRFIKTKINKIL